MDCSPPQVPLSMGFYRQEYWSGLLFPSPRIKPGLLLCRKILYQHSYKRSPKKKKKKKKKEPKKTLGWWERKEIVKSFCKVGYKTMGMSSYYSAETVKNIFCSSPTVCGHEFSEQQNMFLTNPESDYTFVNQGLVRRKELQQLIEERVFNKRTI